MNDLRELAAGWEQVVAVRDASPLDCPCREATGPLIEAWFGKITVQLGEDDVSRSWADLQRARTAQSGAGLLPLETGDWILDVRDVREVAERHRPGAVNIPLHAGRGAERGLSERLSEVPRDRRIVVFCKSGVRAEHACQILRAAGYRHVCNGHDETCPVPDMIIGPRPSNQTSAELNAELPALRAMAERLDPRVSGATGDSDSPSSPGLLRGLISAVGGDVSSAASDAGRGAAGGATDAAKAAIPGLIAAAGEAVRAEVPKVASTAGDAAKAEVPGVVGAASEAAKPAAEAVGEAAGRGAARGAKVEAGVSGFVKVVAVLVGVGALAGVGFAVFGKKGGKS